MLTLSQATSESRTFLKWAGIVAAGLVGLIVLVNIVLTIKEFLFPTPPPKPTVLFGKLPKINFGTSNFSDSKFKYSLNTVSGNLPTFKDQVRVYKVFSPSPDLLGLNKTKSKIQPNGFLGDPVAISNVNYQWKDSSSLQRKLIMNIFSYNFDMTSSYLTNNFVLSQTNMPDQTSAAAIAQNYLDVMGLYPDDIDNSKTQVNLYSINGTNLVPATSLSRTQVLRVDLFQKDLDKMPIFYPNPNFSTMNFLIGGGQNDPQVLEAHFYYPKLGTDSSTYPIKTTDELYNELLGGKAFIATYDGTSKSINITDVILAYYISPEQKYYLPIAVFKGDNNFYAYVPALKDEWVGN